MSASHAHHYNSARSRRSTPAPPEYRPDSPNLQRPVYDHPTGMHEYPSSYSVPRAMHLYGGSQDTWANQGAYYSYGGLAGASNDYAYPSQRSPVHQSSLRRPPPPLNMSGANYGPSTHETTIRSPTASYPVQYTTPQANATEHYQPSQTIEFRSYPSHPRASDYPSPAFSPPPISPSSTEEQLVKKKRKRADAHQLKVLNETYARTAFPTTEERLALAHQLDMTARTVQIWFQNKRQTTKQTNKHSTSVSGRSSSPVDLYGSSGTSGPQRGPSHSPGSSSHHRRLRTQDDGRRPSRQY